jgi:hypothetical protein
VKYVVKTGTRVDCDWIMRHVVLNMGRCYPPEIALVLGTALLWVAFDDDYSDCCVPLSIMARIELAYSDEARGDLSEEENPVEKVKLTVYQVEDSLMMDELHDNPQEENDSHRPALGRSIAFESLVLSKLGEQEKRIDRVNMSINSIKNIQQRGFAAVNRNLNRMNRQPACRFREDNHATEQEVETADGHPDINAQLSNCP